MNKAEAGGAQPDAMRPEHGCEHYRMRYACRGQAMTEYIVIAGLLIASLGILTVFFTTFKEYGGRVLALVSSEYP